MTTPSPYAPVGSKYERLNPRERPRRWKKRVKRFRNNRLEELGCILLPWLYGLFIRLVWYSSITKNNFRKEFAPFIDKFGGLVAMLWHQEVCTAPYTFRRLNVHTLASTTTLGRLITAILESNQFKVFRGGRRLKTILKNMIRYYDEDPDAVYGITVDGSVGPARRMKQGACVLAREKGKPMYVTCTRARRNIFLKTWDRTAVPLPFNYIETLAIGPYWIDPNCSEETFLAFCDHMQNELLSLTSHLDRKVKKGAIDPLVRQDFPDDWDETRWSGETVGIPFSEWDLQQETAPPWNKASKK